MKRTPKQAAELKRQCQRAGITIHSYYYRVGKRKMTHEQALAKQPKLKPPRMLNEDQVLDILSSDISDAAKAELAKKHNCSVYLIEQVQRGYKYADMHPDMPRENRVRGITVSCWNCIHHCEKLVRTENEPPKGGSPKTRRVARCTIGLPDPITEGAAFAKYCACYRCEQQQCEGDHV